MTNLSSIAKIVSNFAPALGAVLPIPGGAAIGSAIAAAFGAKDINDPTLEAKIQADPKAAIKLKEIEANLTFGLEQEKTKQFAIQTADVQDARKIGLSLPKDSIDNKIKFVLVLSCVGILFLCIAAISFADINQNETTILSNLLNLVGGGFLAMLGYYWGSSQRNIKNK